METDIGQGHICSLSCCFLLLKPSVSREDRTKTNLLQDKLGDKSSLPMKFKEVNDPMVFRIPEARVQLHTWVDICRQIPVAQTKLQVGPSTKFMHHLQAEGGVPSVFVDAQPCLLLYYCFICSRSECLHEIATCPIKHDNFAS